MMKRRSTSLRMPEDIRVWAEMRAAQNHRSLSSEIISILYGLRSVEEAALSSENCDG